LIKFSLYSKYSTAKSIWSFERRPPEACLLRRPNPASMEAALPALSPAVKVAFDVPLI
jgi:hypothetical protein